MLAPLPLQRARRIALLLLLLEQALRHTARAEEVVARAPLVLPARLLAAVCAEPCPGRTRSYQTEHFHLLQHIFQNFSRILFRKILAAFQNL